MRDDPATVDLLLRARSGDQSGWDGLVERFAPLVWSICQRYRLADADDVGQSVWLKLLEHIAAIREPAALPGWIATTTRRECQRLLRVSRAEVAVDSELATPGEPSAEDVLLVEERNAAVRAAFAQLPSHCRRLLALFAHDPPLSYAEIGDQLGVPVGGLGPTRARCLNKLRRCARRTGRADLRLVGPRAARTGHPGAARREP
ncbi:MAG TPA: sigma-70 family RNA polymerase sigma factor [Pseudonocardiaceae bacterium]|jgi:RNA polymerase sigma factor (sigma-70 family)|nr:sigma-70 family RNA polymerase sigma factor [Pseudonocardiaceae bacterium]